MNEKTKKRLSPMKKRPRSDSEEAYVSREELDIKNPMPQLNVPPSYTTKGTNGDRIVIVMVGLPARGKTYMVRAASLFFFSISEFHDDAYRQIESLDIFRSFTEQPQKCLM